MKAFILAAGRGSRLKELTNDRPKCLMEVSGRPLIEWQLDALSSAGIRDISIITGYRADMLEKFPAKKIHNPQWDKGNMVKSLLSATDHFDSDAIVTYSDILYQREVVNQLLRTTPHDVVVVYDTRWRELWESRFDDPLSDAETFKITQEGRILEIGKKPMRFEDIQGQYLGLIRFSRQGLRWVVDYTKSLPEDIKAKLDMTSLLEHLIEAGHPVHGMPIAGGWCEVDNKMDLSLAKKLFEPLPK